MTRFRLAAVAALSIPALLVTTSVGQAQRDAMYRSTTTCKTKHRENRDFAKFKTVVKSGDRDREGKPPRRGTAAAFVPVKGAKVITKLVDLTPSNGNNVVGKAKQKDLTNKHGIAKTKHEFNNFGNYRATVKVKVDGDVVAKDAIDFGVADRESGRCDPPLPGAG